MDKLTYFNVFDCNGDCELSFRICVRGFPVVELLEFDVDGVWSRDLSGLEGVISADFKSPRDRHADHDLAYIARRNFKWTTWGSINDFDLSLTFLAASKRYTNTKNDDHLGGYSLWNAAVAYNVNNYFKVNGKIDNIFNKKYEYAAGYKTPETTLAVGFELNY